MRLTLLLLALPAGATSRPVLALTEVEADECDTIHGTIEVRERRRDRVVELRLDDHLTTVDVPGGATRVPFELHPDRWEAMHEVHASWRWVDTDPVWVEVPPWAVSLVVTPPEDPAAGEHDPVRIELGGRCPGVTGRFSLTASVGDRRLMDRLVDDVAVMPLELPEGVHVLGFELYDHDLLVDRQRVEVLVGPPCVDTDGDGYPLCRHQDCDDHDPGVHPGAVDVVGNGIDEDCDGHNGQDRDGDGYEDRAVGGDDCDDKEAAVHPGAVDYPDADGDGSSPMKARDLDCDGHVDEPKKPWDCDDTDPTVPREEAPVPTGVDEDCDGLVDEGTVVFDDDGDGLAEVDGDCDDTDASIRPGARELPDCRDQDCDGEIDEGAPRPARDDAYEPDDEHPAEIPGAWYRRGLLGGSWKPSHAKVPTVTRDLSDVERFSVYAHDGAFDSFYVSVRVDAIGDGRTYRVEISDGGRVRASGTLSPTHRSVTFGGSAGTDDTGTYTIEVRPEAGELDWCPLLLSVDTG
ncbi:MAG: putative metal-binding motif-containing protein [Alphaproteobacteria bacterium]|nr:putative metal-binding motif-containing protein [Alphaproteobacteria bacterium]MCB9697507.1 putative metal-binding motif-containing protein [Alphaproteobacteria bacterium]